MSGDESPERVAQAEVIEERREQLDQKRQQLAADRSHKAYWMRCPKCGVVMQEINLSGILVDQCEGCGGLFFDHGELETLLAIEERKGFFNSMRKVLDN